MACFAMEKVNYKHPLTPSSPRTFSSLGARLGQCLLDAGWTMATAESCTGGTIASMMTAVAGSSAYFKGSVVSYAVEVKEEVLDVDVSAGVVSSPVAEQMAAHVAHLLKTDCAVSTTGVAGPSGGTPECPVGTVWMGVYFQGHIESRCFHFEGGREEVILQAADAALAFLWEVITRER